MKRIEIICPAGTPAALRVAIDEGADAVYLGFRDETNARNFPGLNFSRAELVEGVKYAHAKNRHVYVAINTFPDAGREKLWHQAVDDAVTSEADAIILADIGLLAYARKTHPHARLHLSVQASASTADAISFYVHRFGVRRVVLPRVLTLKDISAINRQVDVETEVFAFGGMCPMAEGRCSLSSYITGQSPNRNGVCSPASHVEYANEGGALATRLGGFTINRFSDSEGAGYPTLCKGRFVAQDKASYIFEDPVSLNVLSSLPEIAATGVKALKIEGRQRGKGYVRDIVRTFRQAVDAFYANRPGPGPESVQHLCEGQVATTGAYEKGWR
ncbi:U32 family peptidase [Asticcacaulis sp. BYS171W]|uniref:Ubiquinone biosynthesis protein UbiU n=1 Tax=Asticcacaulis aquaticus TaxID=2984212 RepID=A0ABT5HWH0_9CAUL|nr:peptidase U32 family protein [Asticcacaulis aquaticus]MDC7684436.1 U32 family peptidase [Asticcacaulis aquaticus]